MRLDEVQRRVHRGHELFADGRFVSSLAVGKRLYRDTLRALLDHDLPNDARQLIEAALEVER